MSALREDAFFATTLRQAAALALLAIVSPVAAQEAPENSRAALWVHLRISQFAGAPGAEFQEMKADVSIGTEVEAFDLTLRIRTGAGTLECFNEYTLYPQEPSEVDCIGVTPAPPLASVSQVTAEVWTERGLFVRPTGFRCQEAPRQRATRIFACNPRMSPTSEVLSSAPLQFPDARQEDALYSFGPFEEPVVEHRVRRLILEVDRTIVQTIGSTAQFVLGWMPCKLEVQLAVDVVTLCFQLSEMAVGIRFVHLELKAQFVRADNTVRRPA